MSNLYSSEPTFVRISGAAWAPIVVLSLAGFFASQSLAAQPTPASGQASSSTAAKRSPRHRMPQAEVPPPPAEEEKAPEVPQPEPPKWPVDNTPNKPSVVWDSAGLKIQANNSSLHDILKEVSADTGAKVEGIGADERVFGEFGPGTARDVVSQLLHGSSYNVLLIGDQGSGTPREIVLSARRAGSTAQQPNRQVQQPVDQPDEDVMPDQPEDNDQSGQPPIINNGRPPMQMGPQGPPGPPGAPRTPQQVLQELQQRQQQIQDQQQQQQPH
jgi:hypothetical protein